MNYLVDPGLELGGAWTFAPAEGAAGKYASREEYAAHTGEWGGQVAKLLSPTNVGIAVSPVGSTKKESTAHKYIYGGWFKFAAGGDTANPLIVRGQSCLGNGFMRLNAAAGTIKFYDANLFSPAWTTTGHDFTEWTFVQSGKVTGTSDVADLKLRVNVEVSAAAAGRWYFDDVFITEINMAVQLAERGVAAIVAQLQSDLETELTAIDTDRSDAITTAGSVTTYYTYPMPVIGGGETHIEVFEGPIDYNNFYSDANSGRVTYKFPLTVRTTYFNRSAEGVAAMTTRGRRLSSGIVLVFSKSPDLGGTDAAIQIVGATTTEPQWITADEDDPKVLKQVITTTLEMMCEEIH